MFKKIDFEFVVEDYIYGDKIVEYGSFRQNNILKPKIAYHVVTGQCESLLDALIPKQYHNGFTTAVMDINADVGPHTDSEILVTINHYVHTNDEKTTFYSRKKDVQVEEGKVRNQTNGSVFHLHQLDVYGSFVAKTNETWVLNVTQPHSVSSSRPATHLRRAIVLQSRVYTFDRVLEMLTEHGLKWS